MQEISKLRELVVKIQKPPESRVKNIKTKKDSPVTQERK